MSKNPISGMSAEEKRIASEKNIAEMLVKIKEVCDPRVIKKAMSINLRHRKSFYESYLGYTNKRTAIKAKCLDCSDFQIEEIIKCASVTCPLWQHRPYKK